MSKQLAAVLWFGWWANIFKGEVVSKMKTPNSCQEFEEIVSDCICLIFYSGNSKFVCFSDWVVFELCKRVFWLSRMTGWNSLWANSLILLVKPIQIICRLDNKQNI